MTVSDDGNENASDILIWELEGILYLYIIKSSFLASKFVHIEKYIT